MALVSMKTKDDGMPSYEPNPYGYGLSICLTEDQVEALGLNASPPAAGSSVGIRAVAIVSRLTQESDLAGGDGDIDVRLELQITDLEVTPGGGVSTAAAASSLYGGDND